MVIELVRKGNERKIEVSLVKIAATMLSFTLVGITIGFAWVYVEYGDINVLKGPDSYQTSLNHQIFNLTQQHNNDVNTISQLQNNVTNLTTQNQQLQAQVNFYQQQSVKLVYLTGKINVPDVPTQISFKDLDGEHIFPIKAIGNSYMFEAHLENNVDYVVTISGTRWFLIFPWGIQYSPINYRLDSPSSNYSHDFNAK
jgi:hypothetical protein